MAKSVRNQELTESELEQIRERYRTSHVSMVILGEEFGVSSSTIWQVLHFHGRYAIRSVPGKPHTEPAITPPRPEQFLLFGLSPFNWTQVFVSLTNINTQEIPDKIPEDYWVIDGRTYTESRYLAILGDAWAAHKRFYRLPKKHRAPLSEAIAYFVDVVQTAPDVFALMLQVSPSSVYGWLRLGRLLRQYAGTAAGITQ